MRFNPEVITNADMARVFSTFCIHLAPLALREKTNSRWGGSFLFCLTAMALGGCASVGTVEPNGSLVRHYLGYVKVAIPQAAARGVTYTSDISVLGLRIAGGIGAGIAVGYSRDRQLMMPLDCRFAVLVANQSQLDDAVARLNTLSGHPDICAVVNPSLEPNPTGETP
jgi:hypothetical protein